MISLYDHIQELRAELNGCVVASARERAQIKVELDQAVVRQVELDRGFAIGRKD